MRLFLVILLAWALPAVAQFQRPDPYPVKRFVDDPPVRILAEKGLEGAADQIAAQWSSAARGIADELGLERPRPVSVYLLQDHTFTRWAQGLLPEWGVGFASWPDGPIALNVGAITGGRKPMSLVLKHEISHVYLGQRLNGVRPPSWFVEGVAQQQAAEWGFGDTMSLVQVASVGALPPLSRLVARFPSGGSQAELAYRVSLQALVEIDRRLADRGGWTVLVERTAQHGDFVAAFESTVGVTLPVFETELMSKLRGRYGWIAAIAGASSTFTLMTLVFLLGVVRAKRKKWRRLREMEEEEARMAFEEWDERESDEERSAP